MNTSNLISSETAAANSAAAAGQSEVNAAQSAINAADSEANAGISEVNAQASEDAAAQSAIDADASALLAANSASSASNSEAIVTALYEDFDSRYLGPKVGDPTTDNTGDPLQEGALYFNTVTATLMIYDGGTWSAATTPSSNFLLKTNNLSDLTNIVTARTNLGLTDAATAPLLDDDTFATATNTSVATSESIKAYVDAKTAAQNEASEITFDPTTSSIDNLDTNVQSALEGVAGRLDTNESDILSLQGISHDPLTVVDTAEIDLILTGQQLSSSIKPGSIDETKLDVSVNASLDLADSASQPGHTHTASEITDFDTEVSNNTDVAANTAARHTHANKAILDAITASYTSAEQTKLSGIEAGAQVNVPTNLSLLIDATSVTIQSDTGNDATINSAIPGIAAGILTAGEKSKLDGIQAGAQVNVPTNLSTIADLYSVTIESSTGTDAVIGAAMAGVTAGVMAAEDKAKLNGIEAGAKDDQIASEVPYTNTTSGLTATNVQAAIDEIDAAVDSLSLDHGNLTGLSDDDHPQYHNDTRAYAWLSTKSTSDLVEGSNLYFTQNKVLTTLLTGFTVGSASPIINTDTVLQAFQKTQSQLNALDSAVTLQGSWDASSGLFPGGGTAQIGYSYIVSIAGTVDSVSFNVNDRVIAIADNASTTTYAANWFKADYTDQVLSVNSQTGAVVLTTTDIGEGTNLYFTESRVLDTDLLGFVSGSGTVTSADSILEAIQKLDGNINANVSSQWITSGANIYYSAGIVSIGTASSTTGSALTVSGRISQIGLGDSTFIGFEAGKNDDLTNNDNVAIGHQAFYSATNAVNNTAIGAYSLFNLTSNFFTNNTAIGAYSLTNLVTGTNNVAIGTEAGYIAGTVSPNTIANQSVYIGANTKANAISETNQIVIGYSAKGAGSNSVVLGNDSITKTILKGDVSIGLTSTAGALNVFTGTATHTFSSIEDGSISFLNGSPGVALPTIVGKSVSQTGLSFSAMSSDTPPYNIDMLFDIREHDNTDFATITNLGGFAFLRSGTELLRIARDGNTGINAGTPANKLSVGGNVSIGDNYTGLSAPTNGLIVQGNVGIAATVPATKLQIGDGTPISSTDGIQFGGDTSARLYRSGAATLRTPAILISDGGFSGSLTGNASTATVLQTARTIGMSGVTATATSFNGSANITIPVTAVPASLLTGTITDARISGSYTGMTNLTGSGTVDFAKFLGNAADTVSAPSFTWTSDTNTGIYRPGADQVGITVGGVQSALFTTTTAKIAATAADYIQVNGTTIDFYLDSALDMRLQNNGDLHVDGDVIAYSTTTSDIRLKTNINEIQNPLAKINSLRGVTYDWIKGSRAGQKDYGVIAQEVEKVLPELVREKEIPFIDSNEGPYKTVDYEKLTAVLIEAVKELSNEVNVLKSKLN